MKGIKKYNEAILQKKLNHKEWDGLLYHEKIARVKEELKSLSKAAYLGHNEAQYDLACFYQYGIYADGIFSFANAKKMKFWMKKAADNHFPAAVECMAILYESDLEIQDLDKAIFYYELYDKLIGVKMSRNRKLFLKQIEKGLFKKNENGYFELEKNWRTLIK